MKLSSHFAALLLVLVLGCRSENESEAPSSAPGGAKNDHPSGVKGETASPQPGVPRDHIGGEKAEPPPAFSVVNVFYATDRRKTGSTKPDETFGSDFSEVSYGTCAVSIPKDHRLGELESPKIWKFQFREDPEKHVVLLSVVPEEKGSYFTALSDRINRSRGKSAFIFIHGYNVSFEDAARRTAQMCYDLQFDGAPVFYSWPSKASYARYLDDEASILKTQPNLIHFFEDFVAKTEATNIYLIAHSMGNRAVVGAFADLVARKPELRQKFKEIILTAPDIDAREFKTRIAPTIIGEASRITLYASSADKALLASKELNGFPRLGEAGPGLVVLSGIETIDATDVDTSFVGHSYYAEERSVLGDIYYIIHDGKRANERFGLSAVEIPAGKYWAFKK